MSTSARYSLVPGFSTKDLHFVIRFCEEFRGCQLAHLVHSLCPSVAGRELVKASPLCTSLAYPARLQICHTLPLSSARMSSSAGCCLAGCMQHSDCACMGCAAVHRECVNSCGTYLLACRLGSSWLCWAAWESLTVPATSEENSMSCCVEDQAFPRMSCSRYDPNNPPSCHSVSVQKAGILHAASKTDPSMLSWICAWLHGF